MATKQMTAKQKTIDRLMKSLGAFVALAVIWVVVDLTANVVNPFGLLSLLAGLLFLLTLTALLAIVVVASSLLRD